MADPIDDLVRLLLIQGTKSLGSPASLSDINLEPEPPNLLTSIIKPGSKFGPFSEAVRGSVFASPESPRNVIMDALRRISGKPAQPPAQLPMPTHDLPLAGQRAMSFFSDIHMPNKSLEGRTASPIEHKQLWDVYMKSINRASQMEGKGEQNAMTKIWDRVFSPEGFKKP